MTARLLHSILEKERNPLPRRHPLIVHLHPWSNCYVPTHSLHPSIFPLHASTSTSKISFMSRMSRPSQASKRCLQNKKHIQFSCLRCPNVPKQPDRYTLPASGTHKTFYQCPNVPKQASAIFSKWNIRKCRITHVPMSRSNRPEYTMSRPTRQNFLPMSQAPMSPAKTSCKPIPP